MFHTDKSLERKSFAVEIGGGACIPDLWHLERDGYVSNEKL
jgi:hypothetical protein